jgi:amidase
MRVTDKRLNDLDATAQAELVRKREVSPRELVDAAIEAIESLNPKLNAVIHRSFERARKEAGGQLPDGPFRGVPFVLKDLGCGNLKGDPHHWGTRFLRDAKFCAQTTANIVEKFRNAGLVILGKTNVPELGAWATTEPQAYGATHNPWNLAHSSGGSSGGSAAAVASHIVPAAHASGGGGSIRIPASECGLVGLKPSRGRISVGPDIAEAWEGVAFEFVVTRTVRDAAALLDAVSGPMPGDPYAAAPPERPYREEAGRSPGNLRIGIVSQLPDVRIHHDCVVAIESTAKALAQVGHQSNRDFLTRSSRMSWTAFCRWLQRLKQEL